ncbi:hypothetical protein B0J14DRAFT_601505 [Halenospora varia]|nr:hypothetical protein B0J14DRAFT_601505 [Halenospora varia]
MSYEDIEEARAKRAAKEVITGKGKRGRKRKSAAPEADEPESEPEPEPAWAQVTLVARMILSAGCGGSDCCKRNGESLLCSSFRMGPLSRLAQVSRLVTIH